MAFSVMPHGIVSYRAMAHRPSLAWLPASQDEGMGTKTDVYSAFLVEDSKIIRDNLIVAMDELAATRVVAFAESESEAERWLRAHADGWQIAVIDMLLKQGSGMDVLRACRGRSASQHAVVLTNYADQHVRDQCMALGADAVFDKSTEIDDFLAYCARH